MDMFFKELDDLISNGSKTQVLDYIYTTLDNKMLNSQTDKVNQLLENVNTMKYDLYILIGILTITLNWAGVLPARRILYYCTWSRAHDEFEIVPAMTLLKGLNPDML